MTQRFCHSPLTTISMSYYDEVELEDMEFDGVKEEFHYPCPCGDRFEISPAQLRDAEDIARCPSCTLTIRIIFDPVRRERIMRLTLVRSRRW